MFRVTGSLAKYPARTTLLWYASLVLAGMGLLLLPICQASSERPITPLEALFTSTSAACVTGLAVRSTPDDFSVWGQAVILVLMQLGGIGIITVTTFFTLRFGGRESMRQQSVIDQTLGSGQHDLRWVLRTVILFVLLFEGVGFLILAAYNLIHAGDRSWLDCLWESAFHAVSGFCNAGFSLHNDSLSQYRGSVVINLTIMGLVISGGIGVPVVLDVRRHWHQNWGDFFHALSLHSKLMIIGTLLMLMIGTGMILGLEWNRGLADLPVGERLLAGLFQSTATRTAGFNTVDLTRFGDATLVLIVMLMVVGAGPCSAAGGFKITTLMVLLANSWSRLLGHKQVKLFRRTLPEESLNRAAATVLVFGVVGLLATMAILIAEPVAISPHNGHLMGSMFEVASALGTVGMSLDFTPHTDSSARGILIFLMFLGRLGPITAFVALSRPEVKRRIEYPKEDVLIG